MTHSQGFTLIEMLLSVAIISLLAGLSLPVYASFQNRNDLDITAQSVADMMRRAQVYARGVNGDSQWGVRIGSDGATLFKGANYASRDSSYDEIAAIPGTISVSGLGETVFSKSMATPSVAGAVTLTSSANETRIITLNAKGMVSY